MSDTTPTTEFHRALRDIPKVGCVLDPWESNRAWPCPVPPDFGLEGMDCGLGALNKFQELPSRFRGAVMMVPWLDLGEVRTDPEMRVCRTLCASRGVQVDIAGAFDRHTLSCDKACGEQPYCGAVLDPMDMSMLACYGDYDIFDPGYIAPSYGTTGSVVPGLRPIPVDPQCPQGASSASGPCVPTEFSAITQVFYIGNCLFSRSYKLSFCGDTFTEEWEGDRLVGCDCACGSSSGSSSVPPPPPPPPSSSSASSSQPSSSSEHEPCTYQGCPSYPDGCAAAGSISAVVSSCEACYAMTPPDCSGTDVSCGTTWTASWIGDSVSCQYARCCYTPAGSSASESSSFHCTPDCVMRVVGTGPQADKATAESVYAQNCVSSCADDYPEYCGDCSTANCLEYGPPESRYWMCGGWTCCRAGSSSSSSSDSSSSANPQVCADIEPTCESIFPSNDCASTECTDAVCVAYRDVGWTTCGCIDLLPHTPLDNALCCCKPP
jgi:hypothetical protein